MINSLNNPNPTPITDNFRDWHRLFPAITVPVSAIIYFILSIVAHWQLISSPLTEIGDHAADGLRVGRAWEQLDGIFSRFNYHHPGPVLFWLRSFSENFISPVAGLPPFGSSIIMMGLISTLALTLLAYVLSRETASSFAAPFVFTLAVVFTQGTAWEVWAPWSSGWFLVLSIGGIAAVRANIRGGIIWAVVGATCAIELHVIFAPFGVLLLIISAVVAWRTSHKPRIWEILTAVVLGAVLVCPMILALVRGESPLFQYLSSDGTQVTSGWIPAIHEALRLPGSANSIPLDSISGEVPLATLLTLWILGVMFWVFRGADKTKTVALSLATLLVLLCVATTLGVRQPGMWLDVIIMLVLVCGIFWATRGEPWLRIASFVGFAMILLFWSDMVSSLIMIGVGLWATQGKPGSRIMVLSGSIMLLYFIVISRLDIEIISHTGYIIPVLLLAPPLTVAMSMIKTRKGMLFSLVPLALILATGLNGSALVSPYASTGNGIAEKVLKDPTTAGAHLIVIDHVESPWYAYVSATSTALLAERNNLKYCVKERRWPYWMIPNNMCPDTLPSGSVLVSFQSDKEYHIVKLD